MTPKCMSYNSDSRVFTYNWMLGTGIGTEQVMVTATYPRVAQTTSKSQSFAIGR